MKEKRLDSERQRIFYIAERPAPASGAGGCETSGLLDSFRPID